MPPRAQCHCHCGHSQLLKGGQGPGVTPQESHLEGWAHPLLLLGTHLSTWSVMNLSTDRAFREISNSIISACFCSSCGGTGSALGFQAPLPRSYRLFTTLVTTVWVGKQSPEKQFLVSAVPALPVCQRSHRRTCSPQLLFPHVPAPNMVWVATGCSAPAPPQKRSQILPLSLSGTILWPMTLQRPVRVEGEGSFMISRGTGEGGGVRNLALVQLQSRVHPSWICLFPPAWEQPTGISACGYPSPQLCHALQPPSLPPFQTAWTPHSSIPQDSLSTL